MAKKKTNLGAQPDKNVQSYQIGDALQSYMSEYAAAVIIDRAIPNIDGFKPVQRRLLYTMYKMGLTDGKHTKLNNVGGQAMLLHPHGDSSPAVYTMAAEWMNNVPYAKIDGNGGTIVSGVSAAAAPRYTSTSLTEESKYLMRGLKENAVEMVPNYDQSTTEPVLLPTEFPNVLMNSTKGIAVGMATEILPHNPKEIMQAVIAYLKNNQMTVKDFAKIIKGPDFPTGGLLVGSEQANLKELTYGRTGKINKDDKNSMSYVIRGEAQVVLDDGQKPYLLITSIPYGVTIEQVIESFNQFFEANSQLPIVDFEDSTSDYDNVQMKIFFKKNTPKTVIDQILVQLYRKTKIQNTISANNLIIADGRPQTLGIKEYFDEWLKFRFECTRRQFEFRLDKSQKRQEIVNGLLKLIDNSEEIVKEAKQSSSKSEFKELLQNKFSFTSRQAEAVATLPIYRLGRQDHEALISENEELTHKINKLQELLTDKDKFKAEIIRQLEEVSQLFKDCDRKTKLVEETKVDKIEVDTKKLIKKQNVVVVVKRDGILQRMTPQVYANNIQQYEQKQKIVAAVETDTHQAVIALTKFGLAYTRQVEELKNQNLKYDTESVQKVIASYKSDDETIAAFPIDQDADKNDLVVISFTKLGMIKASSISDSIPSLKTKGYLKRTTKYNGLKLKADGDEVMFVYGSTKKDYQNLVLSVKTNKKVRQVKLKDLPIQGASGSGRRAFGLNKNEEILSIKAEN